MMNYKSTTDVLRNAGYVLTNTCHMDGITYHDFNARKRDASVSLIVDESTGSVERVEVSSRKWDEKSGRYAIVKQNLYSLVDVLNLFKR